LTSGQVVVKVIPGRYLIEYQGSASPAKVVLEQI